MCRLKNIILVCDSSRMLGGIESVAFNSAIGLKKLGYRVVVFSSIGPTDKDLLDNEIEVICLNQFDILSNPNRLKAIFQGLYNSQAKKKFEDLLVSFSPTDTIIHFHCWTKALSSSVFSVTAKYGFRFAITSHDFFSICPNGGLFNYPQNCICKLKPLSGKCFFSNCDSRSYPQKIFRFIRSLIQNHNIYKNTNINLITISKLTERIILPILQKRITKSYSLTNPVSLNRNNKIVDISNNDCYLFIARLSKEKGCDLFCQAITDLGLHGCVLGSGYLEDELRNKYPSIEFAGWVSGEDKLRYIQKAKALILSSVWYETFGLVVAEMKSYGIPCIVPDQSASSEQISDGKDGYIFKSGDLSSLKEIIIRYENSDLKEMQNFLINNFESQQYEVESHVGNLVNIYNDILSN